MTTYQINCGNQSRQENAAHNQDQAHTRSILGSLAVQVFPIIGRRLSGLFEHAAIDFGLVLAQDLGLFWGVRRR